MSINFSGSRTTDVRPVSHQIDNFGPDIQSVTFRYGKKDHTINRNGKSNVKGYTSFKEGTYTLTNGKKTFRRMHRSQFFFLSVVYTDGRVESNDWAPTF